MVKQKQRRRCEEQNVIKPVLRHWWSLSKLDVERSAGEQKAEKYTEFSQTPAAKPIR